MKKLNKYEKLKMKEKVFCKNGKYRERFLEVNGILKILFEGGKYYYIDSGSKYKIQKENVNFKYVIYFLNKLGVAYNYNNDAPRGGKLGDYIKLERKRKYEIFENFINKLNDEK